MGAVAYLMTKLGLDKSEYEAGMRSAQSTAKSFEATVSGMGDRLVRAFGFAMIAREALQAAQRIEQLGQAAERLGVPVENLQALTYALDDLGISEEQVTQMLGRMEMAQERAITGNKQMREAVRALGLSLGDIAGLRADELLEVVAKRFVEAGSAGDAYNSILEMFGARAGPQAVAALREIANGMDALKGKSVSEIISAADVQLVRDLAQAWQQTGRQIVAATARLTEFVFMGGFKAWRNDVRAAASRSMQPSGRDEAMAIAEEGLAATPSESAKPQPQAPAGPTPAQVSEIYRQAESLQRQNAESVAAMAPLLERINTLEGRRADLQREQQALSRQLRARREETLERGEQALAHDAEAARITLNLADAKRQELAIEKDLAKLKAEQARIDDRRVKDLLARNRILRGEGYTGRGPEAADEAVKSGAYIGRQSTVADLGSQFQTWQQEMLQKLDADAQQRAMEHDEMMAVMAQQKDALSAINTNTSVFVE